jgi:hypothetical protein
MFHSFIFESPVPRARRCSIAPGPWAPRHLQPRVPCWQRRPRAASCAARATLSARTRHAQVLDRDGVGQLIRLAVQNGRKTNPALMCGICGEHGGEPSSIEFVAGAPPSARARRCLPLPRPAAALAVAAAPAAARAVTALARRAQARASTTCRVRPSACPSPAWPPRRSLRPSATSPRPLSPSFARPARRARRGACHPGAALGLTRLGRAQAVVAKGKAGH